MGQHHGRHPGELRRNDRLGTQGTQVEGTKNNKISKSSQMRNKKIRAETEQRNQTHTHTRYKNSTDLRMGTQRGTHGTHGELGGLSEGLRGTQGGTRELRELRPLILEDSGGTSPRVGPTVPLKFTNAVLQNATSQVCSSKYPSGMYPR